MEVVYKPPQEQKPEYNTVGTKYPLSSSIMIYGIRKVMSQSHAVTADGTYTALIYQVPQGKTFYLTHSYLQAATYSTYANIRADIYIGYTDILMTVLVPEIIALGIAYPTCDVSQDKSIPLAFQSGEFFVLSHTQGVYGGVRSTKSVAIITGYEVDNTVVAQFI
jgi:hypothetical protein